MKINNILLGLSLASIGLILNFTYRSFIYSSGIFDFHIADTIGSLLCIPAATFFIRGIQPKNTFRALLIKMYIFYFVYELATISTIHGTFDKYDLVALSISFTVCYALDYGYRQHKMN